MRRTRILMLLMVSALAHAAPPQDPHPDRFRFSLFGTSRKAVDCSKPSRPKAAKRDIRCTPLPRPELESAIQKKGGLAIAEPQPEPHSPLKISTPALLGAYARAKPHPTTAALAPIMDGAPLIEVHLCLQADLTLAPCRSQPVDPASRPPIPPPATAPAIPPVR